MSSITAVICTYDRYDLLPRAIESLRTQALSPGDFEILVVDNSPDSAAAEAFGQRYAAVANLKYLVERKPGLSNARNVAAGTCKSEFIAYMDDDAIADPDWLEQILKAFEQFGTDAGVVGGRVDPIWDVPRPPWLHDTLLGHVSVVDWGGECRIAAPHEWFAGTNVSYRTALIAEHGGFPVALGRVGGGIALMGNEEIALSERIRSNGRQLVYAPLAKVSHLVSRDRLSPAWFRRRAAWQAASDFVLRPEQTRNDAVHHWPALLDYFNGLPPKDRSLRGLYVDTDDAEQFAKQLGAVYMTTVAALGGFESCEP